MLLWILIAILTGVAALSVLVPLSRKQEGDAHASADKAVYKDQLAAIDSDLKRGLIDEEAAQAARTEIARRLLAADDRASETVQVSSVRTKVVQGLAVIALPVMALGLYVLIGSPDMKDQPLQARLNAPAENQSVEELVARVEHHLSQNPEDGQGWAVIAPVYLTIGQPQASAQAYSNAVRLLGPTPELLSNLGEAITVANEGLITANARQAFEGAVQLQPDAVKPRFFLALALGQEGKSDEAIKAWEDLLNGADQSAAWVAAAQAELAKVRGGETAEPQLTGPSAEDMAAARDMSEEDRSAMIRSMVEGLASRLDEEGGPVEDWRRLMRAYIVLGEQEKAESTMKAALAAFADQPDDLAQIKDLGGQLGLSGS